MKSSNSSTNKSVQSSSKSSSNKFKNKTNSSNRHKSHNYPPTRKTPKSSKVTISDMEYINKVFPLLRNAGLLEDIISLLKYSGVDLILLLYIYKLNITNSTEIEYEYIYTITGMSRAVFYKTYRGLVDRGVIEDKYTLIDKSNSKEFKEKYGNKNFY